MTVVEQVKSVCFSANIENREGLHQLTVLIRAGQALGRRPFPSITLRVNSLRSGQAYRQRLNKNPT